MTKAYFDTDARLKNAQVMEQRLIDMLKTKTGKVSDLLQVEKELGRVREEIEKMQGELKYWDSQVQFATVTISLAEKGHGRTGGASCSGTRAARALRARCREDLQRRSKRSRRRRCRSQMPQLNRDYSGRGLRDNEHVDRAGRKRRCDQRA